MKGLDKMSGTERGELPGKRPGRGGNHKGEKTASIAAGINANVEGLLGRRHRSSPDGGHERYRRGAVAELADDLMDEIRVGDRLVSEEGPVHFPSLGIDDDVAAPEFPVLPQDGVRRKSETASRRAPISALPLEIKAHESLRQAAGEIGAFVQTHSHRFGIKLYQGEEKLVVTMDVGARDGAASYVIRSNVLRFEDRFNGYAGQFAGILSKHTKKRVSTEQIALIGM